MKNAKILWVQWMRRCKEVLSDEKKRVNVLVVAGLTGLILLAFSEWIPQEDSKRPEAVQPSEQSSYQDYAAELETELQQLIGKVDGVGAVQVMVTLESGEQNAYATDSQSDAEGEYTRDHVLVGNGGLLETVYTPKILGVAVVCEGGEKPSVQNQVSALVAALTGVGSNHITVAKMAASN